MAGYSLMKLVVASSLVASTVALPIAALAQSGVASVYSGQKTANGEYASAGGMTAAHRTLPFGTKVRVTNQHTGRSVVVRINDRGPFVRGRVIDITPAAAHALGMSGLRLGEGHRRSVMAGGFGLPLFLSAMMIAEALRHAPRCRSRSDAEACGRRR
jgi:rare lipoprotein A